MWRVAPVAGAGVQGLCAVGSDGVYVSRCDHFPAMCKGPDPHTSDGLQEYWAAGLGGCGRGRDSSRVSCVNHIMGARYLVSHPQECTTLAWGGGRWAA